jgi:hypothetical protein
MVTPKSFANHAGFCTVLSKSSTLRNDGRENMAWKPTRYLASSSENDADVTVLTAWMRDR